MNKETGEALLKDGKPVTAQAEFKAEKAGGSVEVTFTFDASALAGQDVVVFEKLYYTDGKTEHEIASHEDLKDEESDRTHDRASERTGDASGSSACKDRR